MTRTEPGTGAERMHTLRFLVHDTDMARGTAVARAARARGHDAAVESTLDGIRRRLLIEDWDALAIEVLTSPVPSQFAVRDLRTLMRRMRRPMPATVIYVREGLGAWAPVIDTLIDEVVPGVDRVHGQDPAEVVLALERVVAARPIRPLQGIAIVPEQRVPVISGEPADALTQSDAYTQAGESAQRQ
jgi:hypothetical protein